MKTVKSGIAIIAEPKRTAQKGEPMMLMISLDDAVKVAKRLVIDDMDDDEIIRQELEQKCWIPPEGGCGGKASERFDF